jgi:hypothetical protein
MSRRCRYNPGQKDDTHAFSAQLLARIAFELVSPQWLITASIDVLKRGYADLEMEMLQVPDEPKKS